jgi:hypothetical protein
MREKVLKQCIINVNESEMFLKPLQDGDVKFGEERFKYCHERKGRHRKRVCT